MAEINAVVHSLSDISAQEVVKRELPFVHALYNEEEQLHRDVQDWLAFYLENQHQLPMYEIRRYTADKAMQTLSSYYCMLKDALTQVFKLPFEDVCKWFRCSATEDVAAFTQFYEYAKALFEQPDYLSTKSRALYGRFDATACPVTGKVTGVYEFNGDTPVMLFESVNLQNLISEALGKPEQQANSWWEDSLEEFKGFAGKSVAVVCDLEYIEDSATSETVAQLFEAVGARVYFTSIDGLNHDLLSLGKPFTVDGVQEHPDAIFMLLPWEEMMTSGRDILSHWKSWHRNVVFFEPAWRWFMSHKGMLAFVTHLLKTDSLFRIRWGHLPHLHTELSADYFVQQGLDYVAKPVIGRLSQNITIYQGGMASDTTEGQYAGEPMIYQAYHSPYRVEGRNNFILGGWLSGDDVTTLCFREFDGPVLDLQNERFIAHVLVP